MGWKGAIRGFSIVVVAAVTLFLVASFIQWDATWMCHDIFGEADCSFAWMALRATIAFGVIAAFMGYFT